MITFTCANGNLPTLGCITDGGTSQFTSTNPDQNILVAPLGRQCQVTDETHGSFVSGDFTLAVTYPHEREGTAVLYPLTPTPISWRATAAEVEAILEAAEDTGSAKVFGAVTVSRDVYQPTGESRWSGQYIWSITFDDRPGDVPPIESTPAMTADDGATVTMVVGTTTNGNEVDGGFGLSFCPNGVNCDSTTGSYSTTDSYFDADLTGNEFKHRFSEAFFWRGSVDILATAGSADVRAKYTDPTVDPTIDVTDWLRLDGHDYIVDGVVEETTNPATSAVDGYTHTVRLNENVATGTTDIASFGTSAVEVTRVGPTQAMGYAWQVTFSNKTVGGNQPDVGSPGADLDGSGATIIISETFQGNQLTGTFTLSYDGGWLLFTSHLCRADRRNVDAVFFAHPRSFRRDVRIRPEKVYLWYIRSAEYMT